MRYYDWGPSDEDGPVLPQRNLICVHGYTRNARDFDRLAHYLASHHRYRVICPDIVGRGFSDYLKNPQGYTIPQYVSDMVTLLTRLGIRKAQWVGTSMGGLIGIGLACLKYSPISCLVLNDVGPQLSSAALLQIGKHLKEFPTFADVGEAERYLRRVHDSFNPLSDDDWRFLAKHSVQKNEQGQLTLRYDQNIDQPFRQPLIEALTEHIDPIFMPDLDLWTLYERIKCPTLVIRGENSLLLNYETVARMALSGPKAKIREVPEVGHAPMLMNDEQIFMVRDFLLAEEDPPESGYDWQDLWQAMIRY